ncbi:hypothetical protein GQ600_6035 [Phytophthora cactorum]|nr:hypothetical protein GQ600_6035 [Phytophthora cactorum]
MDVAASNGHLEVVKWLHANSNEGCTTFAMSAAAANGHLEVGTSNRTRWLKTSSQLSSGCMKMVLKLVRL